MIKKLLLLCLICMSAAHADPRIRTETYNKNRVYNVYTAIGRASLLQLEADESLVISPSSVLGIGDAEAWNLGVRGNNIVLKPSKKMPRTNIVVVTNKRTYSFELLGARKVRNATYILRFRYPDSEAAQAAAQERRLQITAAARAKKVTINTEYFWRGKNALLKPTAAYDDGRFTRLIYDNASELPLFYKVLPNGKEALLNYNIDPDDKRVVILHDVIRTVRARLGDEVIEITNKAYVQPQANTTGAGVHGAVRVTKRGL